ncbi:hypothetical protein PG994_001494 [Apiospora phragmitis]|uniref:Heme-degrading domain-containing protein n=1 Tax=Apiospora phragmitis TaxID=2905665 RepID=A0ABR1WTN5_9PEZI
MSSEKILSRVNKEPGFGLQAVLAAQKETGAPAPLADPPENADEVKAQCDTFVLDAFTADDAWELGHLLYARLLPLVTAKARPTLISIASATGHVLFQAAVGAGTQLDNTIWIQRKRATVLRFGCSTWLMHCKFAGDEEAFRAKFTLSPDLAAGYAIHGGGVPIRVRGVEGVAAVVVLSGLKQHEDHGVIVNVLNANWK